MSVNEYLADAITTAFDGLITFKCLTDKEEQREVIRDISNGLMDGYNYSVGCGEEYAGTANVSERTLRAFPFLLSVCWLLKRFYNGEVSRDEVITNIERGLECALSLLVDEGVSEQD